MINKDLYMMKVADAEPFGGGGVAGLQQKTASFKDSLSDTVYQPKDPYLKKFYTGEISSNDAFNYMADSPIYKDKNLEDTVPREYRHLGGNSFISGGYRAPNGKYHKLRTTASIPFVAGMLGMFGAPVAALAGKGVKTFAAGAGLTALGAAGLSLADKLEPKDHMNLVENIRADKAIQDFEAERQVAERATPWLLSHQRDDNGFLSDQDENEYFRTFKPKSKPYVRSFNVKEKTAALAEELNPLKTQVRTDVNIRKADATDLNAILELFNSLSAKDVKFLAYNTKAALIRQLIRSGKHCYVATDKNKIIGFLRESGRPEGYSLLEELVVHPKYRGKKVASKLLRYFHNSFPKTLAKTNAMNTVMQNILKANGYLPENPNSPRIINWRRGNNLLNTGKEKTAALAKELNPVPKPKRDRSAFQTFVDTLSTNKAKHIAGVAGGISGMLAGRELLHSNLTPMRTLGGIGVVGGAALGAKNIYGLYKDYSD